MSDRPPDHMDERLENLGKQEKRLFISIPITKIYLWWKKRKEKKYENDVGENSEDPRIKRFHYKSK